MAQRNCGQHRGRQPQRFQNGNHVNDSRCRRSQQQRQMTRHESMNRKCGFQQQMYGHDYPNTMCRSSMHRRQSVGCNGNGDFRQGCYNRPQGCQHQQDYNHCQFHRRCDDCSDSDSDMSFHGRMPRFDRGYVSRKGSKRSSSRFKRSKPQIPPMSCEFPGFQDVSQGRNGGNDYGPPQPMLKIANFTPKKKEVSHTPR